MDIRTILVTGGTRGIGKAIVLKFAEAGFNIMSCGRNQDQLDALKVELDALGVQSYLETCDVRDKTSIRSFYTNAINRFGGVDVVVNNAGVYVPGSIQDEEDDTFDLMMETNLNSTYYMCKQSIPHLKQSSKPHLFNICSTASITPYINGGTYCISKYAQYGLTKVLREELKQDGIRVTAVLPGATLTSSWSGTELPASRFIEASSVAELIFATYQVSNQAVVEDLLVRPMEGDID